MIVSDAPLPRCLLTFIDAYVHRRDVKKAAITAGFAPDMGIRIYRNARVRQEIDRKLALVDEIKAEIVAKEQLLTKDFLDKELHKVCSVDVEKIPQLGKTKLEALVVGYKNIGAMVNNEFLPMPGDANTPKPSEPPRIFMASEQSILRHKIETTEQVVTRTIETEDPWA
jgi:hypothetical protein